MEETERGTERAGPGASSMESRDPLSVKCSEPLHDQIAIPSENSEFNPLNNCWMSPEHHPKWPPRLVRLNHTLVSKTQATALLSDALPCSKSELLFLCEPREVRGSFTPL